MTTFVVWGGASAAVRTPAAWAGASCTTPSDCDDGNSCNGPETCRNGQCEAAFTLPEFAVATHSAYTTPVIAVMDHTDGFYTNCCDTQITAFTGETADRGLNPQLCFSPPDPPACFFGALCICAYESPDQTPYVINGNYVGPLGDPRYLSYAGHAGYDFQYGFGHELIATRAGTLCKAQSDPVNGHFESPSAWDKFHTFYIDHGTFAGSGYASWYLHATDLTGTGTDGTSLPGLAVGECAPVATGQVVATVGNQGTGVPHLHFEVRRYAAGGDPEGSSARVIDPYGWTGVAADPWENPSENFQAEHNALPLWDACGNGRLDCGEDCDDGNTVDGDCCSATCSFETIGTSCAFPGICADGRCDGAGACLDEAAPRTDCAAAPSGRSVLALRDRTNDERDRWSWLWRGDPASAAFGDPVAGDDYRVCAYSTGGAAPDVLFAAEIPGGGECPGPGGARPCWRTRGAGPSGPGFQYRDKGAEPDGINRVNLDPFRRGEARVLVKGKGAELPLPDLPLDFPVEVQIERVGGACWSATFDTPGVRVNGSTRVFAKNP